MRHIKLSSFSKSSKSVSWNKTTHSQRKPLKHVVYSKNKYGVKWLIQRNSDVFQLKRHDMLLRLSESSLALIRFVNQTQILFSSPRRWWKNGSLCRLWLAVEVTGTEDEQLRRDVQDRQGGRSERVHIRTPPLEMLVRDSWWTPASCERGGGRRSAQVTSEGSSPERMKKIQNRDILRCKRWIPRHLRAFCEMTSIPCEKNEMWIPVATTKELLTEMQRIEKAGLQVSSPPPFQEKGFFRFDSLNLTKQRQSWTRLAPVANRKHLIGRSGPSSQMKAASCFASTQWSDWQLWKKLSSVSRIHVPPSGQHRWRSRHHGDSGHGWAGETRTASVGHTQTFSVVVSLGF